MSINQVYCSMFIFVFLLLIPSVKNATCLRKIVAKSYGGDWLGNGGYFKVEDNWGTKVYGGRGWNFYMYNRWTGDYIEHRVYDTYDNLNVGRSDMWNFIQSLDQNVMVVYGISDSAHDGRVNYWELKSLGQQSGLVIDNRQTFAAIGYKNMPTGTATQKYKDDREESSVEFCMIEQCEYGANGSRNQLHCDCQSGYYGNRVDITCYQCQYPCSTCTSSTNCSSCSNTLNRGSAPNCKCNNGYYENAQQCKACDSKCSKCVNNSTNCIQCFDNNNRQNYPDCSCKPGFYQDSNRTCQSCVSNCIICTNNYECLTCQQQQYFLNSSNTCEQCYYKCLECNNNSTCTVCKTGTGRSSTTPNCRCNPGFYEINGQANCGTCIYPCENCSGGNNQCTSCQNLSNRQADCSCSDGYFDNGNICQSCPVQCKTCNQNQICTSCNDTDIALRDNVTCQCIVGHFSSGNQCLQCLQNCDKCINNTTCMTCSSNLRDPNNNCICKAGYYEDSSNTCQQCIQNCNICSAENQCNTCKSIFRDKNDNCNCIQGYYNNSSEICTQCFAYCQSCTTGNTCDFCIQTERDPNNNCLCKLGFFENSSQLCEQYIQNCDVCSNNNTCTTCNSNLRNINNNCACINGYYENTNGKCQQCIDFCDMCSAQNQCDTCNSNLRVPSENCNCQEGYYNNNLNVCSQCFQNCKNCSSGNTCNKCVEEKRDPNNNCICKPGYFEDNFFRCSSCIEKCLQCSNSTDCIQCDTDLRDPNQDCVCKDGYYEDQNGNCSECDKKCVTCKDGINCLKMKDCGYQCAECYFNRTNCTVCSGPFRTIPNCQCEKGYYEDQNAKMCQKCRPECSTCINYDVCESCIIQEYTLPQCKNKEKFVNWSSIDGETIKVFDILQNNDVFSSKNCDIKCQSCSISFDNCLTCKPGKNRLNNPPQCSCQDGYHDFNKLYSDCEYECQPLCIKCSSPNHCKQCENVENLIMNNQTQTCECQVGFKLIDKKCIKCYQFQGDCISVCPKGYRIIEGNCMELKQTQISWETVKTVGAVSLAVNLIVSYFILRQCMNERFYERHKEIYRQASKQKVQKFDKDNADQQDINININGPNNTLRNDIVTYKSINFTENSDQYQKNQNEQSFNIDSVVDIDV